MYDGGKLYILYDILADKFREAAFYKGSFIMYSENSFPMYYSFFTLFSTVVSYSDELRTYFPWNQV